MWKIIILNEVYKDYKKKEIKSNIEWGGNDLIGIL